MEPLREHQGHGGWGVLKQQAAPRVRLWGAGGGSELQTSTRCFVRGSCTQGFWQSSSGVQWRAKVTAPSQPCPSERLSVLLWEVLAPSLWEALGCGRGGGGFVKTFCLALFLWGALCSSPSTWGPCELAVSSPPGKAPDGCGCAWASEDGTGGCLSAGSPPGDSCLRPRPAAVSKRVAGRGRELRSCGSDRDSDAGMSRHFRRQLTSSHHVGAPLPAHPAPPRGSTSGRRRG